MLDEVNYWEFERFTYGYSIFFRGRFDVFVKNNGAQQVGTCFFVDSAQSGYECNLPLRRFSMRREYAQ